MQMFFRRAFVASICVSVLGCALHPLPEDYADLNTTTIVRKIRCEARQAVIDKALKTLGSEGYHYDQRQLEHLNINDLREPVKGYFKFFQGTGIVYAFSLDGTEMNNASFATDIVIPFSVGGLTLSPSFGNNLTRDNIRAFTVTDNFQNLVQSVPDDYCDFGPSSPNYQYPITGKVGIDEMIDTFVDLTLFNGLGGKTDVATNAVKRGPPAMADTLTFTTTLTAGLTSKATFTSAKTHPYVQDATLTPGVTRIDKHSVTVGLGLPSAPIFENAIASNFVTASPATAGEAAALQAVNQQILRFQVPRPIIVAP